MSRSVSTASSAAMSAPGHSRSLSLKSAALPTKPNNIALFLTNLRLLDLDQRSDWPCITVQTFSTKAAQQNQKERIRCVEWALFRLFEVWDPEETRDKLQPFFPPLEPLQSLNLRAALYRSLNELKKNGVLGRETILRKTMLDECKEEKLGDILMLFSTAVLRKVTLGKKQRTVTPVAKSLSMAQELSAEQKDMLFPLVLAHKASLSGVLQQREEQRAQYQKFSQLLAQKRSEIAEREERCKEESQSGESSLGFVKNAAAIKRQLKDNWLGNPKWLDILVYGEEELSDDALFARSFDSHWSRIERGLSPPESGQHPGLLKDLEMRVNIQQQRLHNWKSFQKRFAGSAEKQQTRARRTASTAKVTPIRFMFDEHYALQFGSKGHQSENATAVGTNASDVAQRYQNLVSGMKAELASASNYSTHQRPPVQITTGAPLERSRLPRHLPSRPKQADPERRRPARFGAEQALSKSNDVPTPTESAAFAVPELPSAPLDSEATLVGTTTEAYSNLEEEPVKIEKSPLEEKGKQVLASDDVMAGEDAPPTHEDTSSVQDHPSSPPILQRAPTPEMSEEQRLAEQILTSVTEATPSPIKRPRPSLLERTRMSMASAFQPLPELSETPLPFLPPPPPNPTEDLPAFDRRASLLERTRQSMTALQSQPRPNPRKSLRKSTRQSLYPVNQFETPRKQSPIPEIEIETKEEGDSTPKEYLFSDDADYDHVFKSRPKIALSPLITPRDEEGNTIMSFADLMEGAAEEGEEDNEEGEDMDHSVLRHEAWESSPLAGRRGYGTRV